MKIHSFPGSLHSFLTFYLTKRVNYYRKGRKDLATIVDSEISHELCIVNEKREVIIKSIFRRKTHA